MGDASVHHAHHQIGLAVQQGFHRRYAQLTGVHAVQAAGRSAALQVPQNGHLGVSFRKTSANGVRNVKGGTDFVSFCHHNDVGGFLVFGTAL